MSAAAAMEVPESRRSLIQSLADTQTLLEQATSEKERVELVRLSRDLEWSLCKEWPEYFIFELCTTHDEHDSEAPYKAVPRKEYIERLIHELHTCDRILIPKSRQVMVTWTILLYRLWRCMFIEGRLCVIQSDKEDDAQAVLRRAFGVWERLPEWMRHRNHCDDSTGVLKFRGTNSRYEAIPSGEHQVRSRTPSDWDNDESCFQETFRASFIAALPALRGGGRATCASSAKAGAFMDMVDEDPVEGTYEVLMESPSKLKGFVKWEAPCGWRVLRIHYTADPDKDLRWAREAAEEYGPLGMEEPDWLAEMEIDPGARAGKLVFPEFSRATHVIPNTLTIAEVRDAGWPLFVGIDPGSRNPCAVLFITVDGDGVWYVIDELYETGMKVSEIATLIKGKLGREWPEMFRIGHDARRSDMQNDQNSIIDRFKAEGIVAVPTYGNVADQVRSVREMLALGPDGQPGLRFTERCKNTIRECEGYRYPQQTATQEARRDPDENPIKKNDHAIDALRMVVCNTPTQYFRKTSRVDRDGRVKVMSLSERAREAIKGQVIRGRDMDEEADFFDD